MQIKLDEIIQIVDREVMWCHDNRAAAPSKEYNRGFINGLIQAKFLAVELARITQEEVQCKRL